MKPIFTINDGSCDVLSRESRRRSDHRPKLFRYDTLRHVCSGFVAVTYRGQPNPFFVMLVARCNA